MSSDVVDPNEARFAALAAEADTKTGPIRMINMIRFRKVAEYEAGAGPDESVSGASAYVTYGQHASKFVDEVGGSQAWAATTNSVIIGPEDEYWDAVFAVEYPNRSAFLQMVSNPEYLAITHHRTAAVADSRLILTDVPD